MAILSTIKNTADKRVEDERIRQAALQKAAAQQGASQGAATGTTSVAPQPTGATSENTGNTAYQPTGATGGNTGSTAYQQYLAAQDRKAALENQLARNQVLTSGTTQGRNALLLQDAQQRDIDRMNASGNTQAAAGMQQMMDAQQRAAVLSSGNQQQINQYLMDQAKAQNNQNAFQAAVAAANPTTTSVAPAPSAASQPAQMKDYTWYTWMGDNNMHTMNDDEKQKWYNAMAGYQQGDYRAFNQDFQTAGNWGSYVDENGNVSGMLRYAGDGIGGYLPVNNGRVMAGLNPDREYLFYGPGGEVYTADANGNLTRSGNWTADYDKVMKNGYYYNDPNRMFQGKDGQFYTYADVPDDKLAEWGYVRRNDGIFYEPQTIATNKALESGQVTREQLAQAQAAQALRDGAVPSYVPSTAGESAPAQNAYQQYLEQATQNTQPGQNQPVQTQPTQNAPVPTQRGSVDYSAGRETPYQAAIDEWEYGPAPQWENSEYQRQRDEALRRAQNMRFSYDPESDPVWQAYQKQYRREGQRAMQDTMAEAAMRTGGLANSYAVSAAAQAGNYYAAELSDRLPQLYNDAYQRYLAEFQRQLGISDQYAGFDQTEYGRYADELGQWNKDRSFDYGLYRDRVGDARYADELAYDRAWNEENRDYSRSYQAKRDAIEDQRYDQEWAQQLREYADQQGWKALDWQQYLREYEDKMSQQEREWAYQQYRDAVGDQQYADQTAWNRATYGQEYADSRADTEWEQGYKDSVFQNQVKQQDIDNAWARIKATGYISEEDAALLGIKPGEYTGSLTTGGKVTGGGGGGGYTPPPIDDDGDDTTEPAAPQSTLTPEQKYMADISAFSSQNIASYFEDLLNDKSLRTDTGPKFVSNGKSNVYHDGAYKDLKMTAGFQRSWPYIRNLYDKGASAADILYRINDLVNREIIAPYEIDVMLDKLNINEDSLRRVGMTGGGGSKNVNITNYY